MIQEPLTPQIPEQQHQGQLRTEYITEPLKSYPVQTNTLLSPVLPRILLIKSSATSPVVTQLVAQPRIQAKNQTRIIRIPFLPSSEPIAILMKQSLPTEKGSVKNSNPDTEFIETTNSCYPQANINYRHLTESISSNTCNYSSNLIGSEQRNQNCYQILYLNQSQSNQIKLTKNQELPPQKPMTLASMAGIQLTSADESHTMEMSGAMQPTATVEEIKVPVFIDEYLQQSTQTSSTTTKTTLGEATSAATIINNNNNYNQYYCENNDNNHNYNGIICLENETLDFDIEMIADPHEMMTMTMGENMENNHSNFYYCTNNNSNNNNNNNNNNTYTNNNNTYNGYNNTAGCIAELEPKVEPQFHTSPGMEHDFLSEDIIYNLDQEMASANILPNEDAVDISHFNNDFSLFTDAICSSQNDPMLTEGQKLTQELQRSEPIIEPDDEYELYKKQDMQQAFHQYVAIADSAVEEDELELKFIVVKEEPKARPTTGAKRKQQQPSMQEKRRKLCLNTKINMNNTADILNTPDLVKLLVDQEPHTTSFFETISIDDIMNDLLDISNSADASPLNANADTTCWTALVDSSDDTTNQNISIDSVTTEAAVADNSNDSYAIYLDDEEDPPYTPSSSTTHTIPPGLTSISSSPNSPALSTISAATTSSVLQQRTQKKRRGRPSKEHSDKPDPAQLVQLTEAERKRLEDRAKNNEASRISRLKNKQKEEAEVEEQEQLVEQNVAMKAELAYLERVTKKLKRALHRRQMLHKR